MNEQSSGCHPDFGNEPDEEQRRTARSATQRAFMDRARRAVEREQDAPKRPVGHRIVALVAALVLTAGIIFVFDAFLSSMQKVLHLMEEQEKVQQQQEEERKQKEPIPAYVVPSD